MAVTISADGLSIIHKSSGGEASATLPDVCLTTKGNSVVPIPYGNTAKSADLADGSTTVTADGGNSIAIKGCKFAKSTGDADGDKKGVASGTIEGEAKFISSSPTVKIEGKGVCRLSDQMTMNKANTMCMGGVQNPPVSVTADEEGTFTVDLTLSYSSMLPVKNATYKLTDGQGSVFSGSLDSNGRATVGGLADGLFSIEFGEDSRDYQLREPQAENPHYLGEVIFDDIVKLLKAEKKAFWEPRQSYHDVWGQMSYPTYSDSTLRQLLTQVLIQHSSYYIATAEAENIAANIQALCQPETEETDHSTAYLSLATGLSRFVDEKGMLYQQALSIDLLVGKSDLLAKLRNVGYGDPERGLKDIDWSAVGQKISAKLDKVIDDVVNVLDLLKANAERSGYTTLVEQYTAHCDVLTQFKRQSVNHLADAIAVQSGVIKVVLIKPMVSKNTGVSTTGNARFSCNPFFIREVTRFAEPDNQLQHHRSE